MDTESWDDSRTPASALSDLDRRLEEARALADASDELSRRDPHLSARSGLTLDQRAGGWSLLGAALVLLFHDAGGVIATLLLLASAVFVAVISLRLAAAIAGLIDRNAAPASDPAPDEDLPMLTALVPLLHEGNMAQPLLTALSQLDYPADRLEILLLVEHDDLETLSAFRALDLPSHVRLLPAPPGQPRTKPRALNYGLAFASGDLIVVFDAEDRPDPRQPRAAAAKFRSGPRDLAVVQAPLLAHNASAGWLASQFALEYAIHFRVWLPFLARMRAPLALGGTSNYFRRDRLARAGGWDAWNVTEDADLGLRLARFSWSAAMIDPPTWEEAPVRWRDWINQRTRWTKGHLQTWLVLMRRPFSAARDMGWGAFIVTQLNLGGSLLAAALHGPILLWLIASLATPLPNISGWYAGLLGAGYGAAVLAAYASRHTVRASDIFSLPLYWPLASWAMIRALWEMKMRPHAWAKTPHGVTPQGVQA